MKIAALALAAALGAATPALADRGDRHHGQHHGRHDWRDDRRDEGRAYRQGYRDGIRADNRADRYRSQRYVGPGAWQHAYNGRGWSSAPVYYDNRGTYDRRTPYYRSSSSRSQPYWWGPNGQVYCRRQDGTAGLVVGAVAGGTLGNVIAREGDKRLGSVIGGTLGAVLGNEIAKGNARCR